MNKHLETTALRVNEYLKQGGDITKASAVLGLDYNSVKTTIESEWGKTLITILSEQLSTSDILTIEERKKAYSRIARQAPLSLETGLDIQKANAAMKAIDYLNNMEGVGNEAANKEASWIERVKESVEASREIAQKNRLARLQDNAASHPNVNMPL